MKSKQHQEDVELTRKRLLKLILQQVKNEKLEKTEALQYLKLIESKSPDKEDIAIVGVACRFPDAKNKEQYWQNLCEGKCSIAEFPEHRRKDLEAITDEELPLFKGGFLDRVDEFDPEFFGIAPQVAEHMDPYHRQMLEVFIETIEDAGYHKGDLYGKDVGVFIGNDHAHRMVTNYLDFIEMPKRDFNTMTGSWSALLAGRISYLLNLRGPAQVIDTSCSSALVALDTALKALADKDCDSALVGGINLLFLPWKNVVGEVENNDSMVCSFDQRAKGTVWGEGVASILIKPLSKAQKDGDDIYGLIKACAVNCDGASNGITAPSSKAQNEVLRKAWKKAGIKPENISYIEAHGTGTHLGDPIEVKGLSEAFSKYTSNKQFCALGSVKTNIGHTVGVSGLASMIKVLMSFKHNKMAPSLNFQVPNQFIDFCNSPIYYSDTLRNWEDTHTRIAGISSFGISGTNAHVVLGEIDKVKTAITQQVDTDTISLFPLSARTKPLLIESVQKYLIHLRYEENANLVNMCYTASIGRIHQKHRAVIGARGIEDLESKLSDLLIVLRSRVKSALPDGVYYRDESRNKLEKRELNAKAKIFIERFIQHGEPAASELSNLYIDGAQLDWKLIYKNLNAQRCHLPSSPFLSNRYWFGEGLKAKKRSTKLSVSDLKIEAETQDPRVMFELAISSKSIKGEAKRARKESSQLVAFIVCETLGYEAINLHDNFYGLGGDSISGTRIIFILNEMLGIKSELSDILATDSIEELVESLCEHRNLDSSIQARKNGVETKNTDETIPVIKTSGNYVLSRAQKRMYLQAQLDEGSTTYNASALIQLAREPLPSEESSIIKKLIQRHEILRTRFILVDDEPRQIVESESSFEAKYIAINEQNKPVDAVLQEVIQEYVNAFDLHQSPLFRVYFISLNKSQFYMLIDMHHIVTDGASMGIFIKEYMQLKGGDNLPGLPVSYKDFSSWDQARAKDSRYKVLKDYWLSRFSDHIPVCQLDTDYPRPVHRNFKGSTLHTLIETDLRNDLIEFSKRAGCSLFVVLMSAFRVLLARYGAGKDLSIGSPVAGRHHNQLQNVMGMFVNTLVLRDKVNYSETFSEFINRVKLQTLKDFDHQDYAYEDLIEALDQRHLPDRNPLFDVCFVLQNQDMGLAVEGALQDIAFDAGISKFDLTVFCRNNADGLEVSWEYASSLYSKQRIEQLSEHFKQLVGLAIKNPDVPIDDLDFYTHSLEGLIGEYNNVNKGCPVERSIGSIFSEISRENSAKIALVHDDREMTYGELESKTNQLANYIIANFTEGGNSRSASNHPVIALWFKPGFEMVIAILATLKAGFSYVPMDISNPDERSELILSDSGAKVLITSSSSAPIRFTVRQTIKIDELDLAAFSERVQFNNIDGESLAYIMYTSGTTGTPKGALIRHKSITRVVKNTNYLHIDSSDVCMLLSNYAFDGCVLDFFSALLNGAKLIIAKKDDVFDPSAIASLIRRHEVTSMFATTSLCNLLIDQQLDEISTLKYMIFGGEAASLQHCRKALEKMGPGRLINGYGPTEATVFAVANVIDKLNDYLVSVPIGKPINNTDIYILDASLQHVPFGVSGELYIGGDGVALGYLNQPELTKERFVKSPFKSGEKLYKTGDLARWNFDREILYNGRIDTQVKIRGFRIELSEIETCITSLPEVDRSTVVDLLQNGRKILAAYIVAGKDSELSISKLRASLSKILPEYMVPDSINLVDDLPLNANGKVNRNKLPAAQISADLDYQPPSDEIEEQLCELWQGLLGLERVGVDDNFFRIGGDSILSIQMVTRLRQFGYQLQVKDVFSFPSVAQLAQWLRSAPKGPTVIAEQGELSGEFDLLPIQKWFFEKKLLSPHHWNQSFVIGVPSELQADEITQALFKLSQQHDILRCRFDSVGTQGKQRYLPAETINQSTLRIIEESRVDPIEVEALLEAFQKQFNYSDGPLWGACLLKTDSDNLNYLVFAFHHLIIDAVSWRIIVDQFQRVCKAEELPPKTSSYRQWVDVVRTYADEHKVEAQYWENVICDQMDYECQRKNSKERKIALSKSQTASLLREANSGYNTEVNDLLLSAMAIALSRTFKALKNHLTLESHGRAEIDKAIDLSQTVGWFTTAYPVALEEFDTLAKTIVQTKETLRKVPNKGIGYGAICGLSKLPTISFNYLGQLGDADNESEEWQLCEGKTGNTSATENKSPLVLDINGAVKHGQLVFFIASRLDEETSAFFAEQYALALDEVIKQGKRAALSGGETTPSDFDVQSLSFSRLEKIQSKLSVGSKPKPKPKKNKMKI